MTNFAQQLSFSFEDGENTPFVTFPANKRICVEGIKPKRNVKPLLPQLQTGLPLEKFLALYDITSISYKHSLLNIDNNKITKTLLSILEIKADLTLTSDYIRSGAPQYLDLRNAIHPKVAQEQGKDFYDATPYPQVFDSRRPFEANLSVIDTIFNCGRMMN